VISSHYDLHYKSGEMARDAFPDERYKQPKLKAYAALEFVNRAAEMITVQLCTMKHKSCQTLYVPKCTLLETQTNSTCRD